MDCPQPRAIQPPKLGSVVEMPDVGGLHHHYERMEAEVYLVYNQCVADAMSFRDPHPMNRSELVTRLAQRHAHLSPQDVAEALVAGERIEIRGFGSFTLHAHAPRTARNPKTGETLRLPARRAVRFKAGKSLRERVNGSAHHPAPSG